MTRQKRVVFTTLALSLAIIYILSICIVCGVGTHEDTGNVVSTANGNVAAECPDVSALGQELEQAQLDKKICEEELASITASPKDIEESSNGMGSDSQPEVDLNDLCSSLVKDARNAEAMKCDGTRFDLDACVEDLNACTREKDAIKAKLNSCEAEKKQLESDLAKAVQQRIKARSDLAICLDSLQKPKLAPQVSPSLDRWSFTCSKGWYHVTITAEKPLRKVFYSKDGKARKVGATNLLIPCVSPDDVGLINFETSDGNLVVGRDRKPSIDITFQVITGHNGNEQLHVLDISSDDVVVNDGFKTPMIRLDLKKILSQ